MFNNPLAGAFTSLVGNIGNAVGSFFGGSSPQRNLPSYDEWKTQQPGYVDPNTQIPAAGARNATAPRTSSADDQRWQEMSARLDRLLSSMPPTPTLPDFDILGNYNRAKQRATSEVTPLYEQKLNNFLEGQNITRTATQQQRGLDMDRISTELAQALQDVETGQGRTTEDLTNALADIAQTEQYFLSDEGTAFDESRRALQEDVAAEGGTETGLGQQQISTQLKERNKQAARQIDEFRNNEAAKQLLADRSLEDLSTQGVRAEEKKMMDERQVKIDFDKAMKQLANEEKSFRLTNELEKALDIVSRTSSYQGQGVAEFIAGLAGQGYSGQDIQLAKQVYG